MDAVAAIGALRQGDAPGFMAFGSPDDVEVFPATEHTRGMTIARYGCTVMGYIPMAEREDDPSDRHGMLAGCTHDTVAEARECFRHKVEGARRGKAEAERLSRQGPGAIIERDIRETLKALAERYPGVVGAEHITVTPDGVTREHVAGPDTPGGMYL